MKEGILLSVATTYWSLHTFIPAQLRNTYFWKAISTSSPMTGIPSLCGFCAYRSFPYNPIAKTAQMESRCKTINDQLFRGQAWNAVLPTLLNCWKAEQRDLVYILLLRRHLIKLIWFSNDCQDQTHRYYLQCPSAQWHRILLQSVWNTQN